MYPVLCSLPYEVLLPSTCSTVSFDGVPSCADQVVQLRKLHDRIVIVVLEERLALESRGEYWLEMPRSLFL